MRDEFRDLLVKWLNRPTGTYGFNEARGLGALATCIGNVRSENQDRAIVARFTGRVVLEGFIFFGLCDGIGGLRDGATCASRGLAMFLAGMVRNRGTDLGRRLVTSADAANADIFQDYHENGGATLSAVVATARGELLGINVGDSRIYRRAGGVMAAMTLDDNIGSQLRLLGRGDAAGSPLGRQLTQFLGIGKGLEPKIIPIGGTEATHFLTSDGIHGLGERILSEVAVSAPNLTETARRITTVAKWCKGSDNGTIVSIAPNLLHIVKEPIWEPLEMLEVWDSFGSLSIAGDRLLSTWRGYQGVAPAVADLSVQKGGSEQRTTYAKGWQKKGGAKKKNKKQTIGAEKPQPELDVQITEGPAS